MSSQHVPPHRTDDFIKSILGLQEHYDDGLQFLQLKGGAVQFTGFKLIKCRRLEAIAQRCGKAISYTMKPQLVVIAVDDTTPRKTEPMSLADFCHVTGALISSSSPPDQPTRRHVIHTVSVSSARVRNLLAHPENLDVWLKQGSASVVTIPPSRVLGGLSERAAQGLLYVSLPPGACQRPRFRANSRKSSTKLGRSPSRLRSRQKAGKKERRPRTLPQTSQ